MRKNAPLVKMLACVFFVLGFIGPSFAAEITRVEINQVIGLQKDNNLNYVAGKDTAILAFLSEDVSVDASNSFAKVYRDGSLVATLSPRSYDKPVKTVEFLCPSRGECGDWAAGTYRFEVSVNGMQKNEPVEGSSNTYVFKERRQLRILAMPVKANYNGVVTQVSDDKWKTMYKFTSSVYPVAADRIKWEIRPEFDASADKYNLETDSGQRQLWEDLTNLMPANCANDPNGEGCYDLIVGFISDRPNTYPEGRLQGFTYGKPTNIVVAKDEDAPATVAHEIAHVFGIGDTYDGGALRCSVNPAPDGFSGKNWDNFEETTSCSSGRVALDQISATKIPSDIHSYEVGGRGLLGDMACYMGSGGLQSQYWTTPETYAHLFDQLAPLTRSKRNPKAATQRFISFLGYVNEAGEVEIEPWETFDDSVTHVDTEGTYTIAAVDNDDNILATKRLDISFYILSTPPEPIQKLDWAPFQGAMPFPAGTTAFYIMKNGEVIGTVPVSSSVPVVSNVMPGATSPVSGEYKIKWTATDADNDSMNHKIEYNPDVTDPASEWLVLTGGADVTEWEESFDDLPGGNHAKIRVTSSDWVLSSSSESSEFTVPFKAPEVFIDDPEWGDSYEEGDEVLLEAEVYDVQDDTIPDANIKWKSNIDGDLGTGTMLITDKLSMGEHTITITATNSRGLSKSDSITLKVGNVSYGFIEYGTSGGAETSLTNNYKNLKTDVKIPVNAASTDLFVLFESLSQPSSGTGPSGYFYSGRFFGLNAEKYVNEDWVESSSLDKPIVVTIDYSKDLPENVDPSSLKILRFDEASGTWIDVENDSKSRASVYDRSQTGKLSVQINKLGEFAMTGSKKSSSGGCFISAIGKDAIEYTIVMMLSCFSVMCLSLLSKRLKARIRITKK